MGETRRGGREGGGRREEGRGYEMGGERSERKEEGLLRDLFLFSLSTRHDPLLA